jgi:hypothetical protein
MPKALQGVIRGRTIELERDSGFEDGRKVEVVVRAIANSGTWGEGLRRCAGALANDWSEEDDNILHEIYLDRKRDTRREILG